MLERLAIQQFRCFRSIDVPVRPLTVLVGPNDSGKSSFLDAVALLNTRYVQLRAFDHWRCETDLPVSITVNGDLELRPQGKQSPPAWNYGWSDQQRRQEHVPVECFRLPSMHLSMNGPGMADDVDITNVRLKEDGSNVPAMLDVMLRAYRKRFQSLVDNLRELVPGCEDLNVRTPAPDQRRVDFVIEGGLELPADRASAGVKTILFFLTLAYRPGPPKILLIEEPENGVHPRRLAEVMKLFRGIVEGRYGGSPIQIVLTTHSPHLLDHVDLQTDQILVFRRSNDGSRKAEPVDADRLKVFLDEFMLGEVWFNESEEGLVAKP